MRTSPFKSSSHKHKNKISIVKNDTIGDYKIGIKIGQGTFSKVCQGIHIPTGEKVAIKILPKNQIKERNDKIRIEKEITLQRKLHHQNIIQQYSILDTEKSIYIITEYCSGGELFDYIVSKRRLQEVEACRIYQQLINGLEYLHKQKICHRDLKPENLLFDSKHNLKIADFGLSNDYVYGKLSTPCGSPCYAAPEMVTGKKYYGDTVDIWSSGIVLYSMVCGYLPFEDDNQSVLFHKIAKGLFSMPSFLSNSCKDLIRNILITNPNKRYGFEEIKNHPWFMSINNIGGKNILFASPGIVIDYDVLPIDIDIIKEIYFTKEYKNFSILNIVNDVIRDKHNKITTAYYLLLRKKLRNNEESISNINSNSKPFIQYMKKPMSKMEYWNNNYDKIIDYYTYKAKEVINKEKENRKKIENEKSKKNKINNLEILNSNDDLNFSNFQEFINGEQKENNYLESNFSNNDIKLSTIVYDEEEKNLLKKKNKNKKNNKKTPKKRKYNSYQKENEDSYLEFKMNNYELDSDEPIINDIYDSNNKKQFYEILKTNGELIEPNLKTNGEENAKNDNISESNDIIFNNIINKEKLEENEDESNENIQKINVNKGRNKSTDIEKIQNKSVSTEKPKNMDKTNLLLSNKKQNNHKNILNTEVNNNNDFSSLDKNIKKDKHNNNVNSLSLKNKKKKTKKKKFDMKNFNIPSNSYLYKKLATMLNKEDKLLKFVNKKKLNQNNLIQTKIDDINKNNKNANININNENIMKEKKTKKSISQENKTNYNDNFGLNAQINNNPNEQKETDHISRNNDIYSSSSHPKDNNNLNIKKLNNLYKNSNFKINLINNIPNYRKDKDQKHFYKKLNNINKYNKYVMTNPNGNNTNKLNNSNLYLNNIKSKKHFNNSQSVNKKNNLLINKYLMTENNQHLYKKSYPNEINNSDLNINGKIKSKINPIFLSEIPNKKRKIIKGSLHNSKIKNNPGITQSGSISYGPRTNSVENDFLKDDKIASKIKIKSPPKVQNGSNSVEIKNNHNFNLPSIYNINKHYIVINNTYYSNGSEQNISLIKEKTPKNGFITEVNNDIKNNNKKYHTKNYSYDIKNDLKFSANKKNKKSLINKKIVYYKKFINLNKRYNNSVENDARQQQNSNKKRYILDLLSSNLNNYKYNNSLIPINPNKYKNKKNLINSNRPKKKVKNLINKKTNYLSQEKAKNNNNLNLSPFAMHIKSNILTNKNNLYNQNLKCAKSIKNENNKFANNFNEKRIIDKINKIPSLICCKSSVEKIRNAIEKIYMKKMISIKEKNYPMITVNNSKSSVIIKCRFVNRLFNLNFELHISPFNEATNYILIKPSLKKGNSLTFVDFFDKIKKELLN